MPIGVCRGLGGPLGPARLRRAYFFAHILPAARIAWMPVASVESPEKPLTARQLEVLELMAKGLTNKEIGGVLEISPGTVKVHVAAVIRALDVTNRTEATNRLHELRLVDRNGEGREAFRVNGFGDRPAIAVLPFANFSDDPTQDFLADGLVEDLITSLAGWRWFPVLARNSTFVYKGEAVDIKEVSRALGAGFVIEGSVRRAGDRVRITVQVLDGASAEHVWANHYDCELDEVFKLSDEIVAEIVASLEPALVRIGGLRVLSHRPEQLGAWQNLQRAYVHAGENRLSGFVAAQSCLDRATELDPEFSVAWALSTYCQFHLHLLGYEPDDGAGNPAARLAVAANRLAELDTTDPFAPLGNGMRLMVQGERKQALAAMRRAVELGPSLTFAVWGMAIAEGANGNPKEAIGWIERAFRLCPRDPLLAPAHLNHGAYLMALNRSEGAEAAFERSVQWGPELPYAYPFLAIFHALRGEHDRAQARIARMNEIQLQPHYSPMTGVRVFAPPEQQAVVRSLFELVGLGDAPDV